MLHRIKHCFNFSFPCACVLSGYLFFGFLLTTANSISSNERSRTVDSLLFLLKTDKEDTAKVIHLYTLCDKYRNTGNYDTALYYGNAALQLARKLPSLSGEGAGLPAGRQGWGKGIAASYNNIGIIYADQGNYDKALENYFASLKIDKEIGDKKGIAIDYNNIGIIYKEQGSYDKALENYFASLKIKEEIGDKKGIAYSYNNIGGIYRNQGNYDKALENYFASLKIKEEIGDKKGIAASYNNIGLVYWNQGNYNKALENYFASLKIDEELGDKKGIAIDYNNIGLIYADQGNYDKALENYFASLKIDEELGDKKGIAIDYNNIGFIYWNIGNYDKALENYFASLKIKEEIGDKKGIAASYNNIGIIYLNKGNYSKALENYFASLKIKEEIGDKQGIAVSYNNIGNLYFKQNKIAEAKRQQLLALSIGKKIGAKDQMMNAYNSLSQCDSVAGDWKGAYEYHKFYSEIKDSIFNEESNKQITEMQTKYETEKKEQQIKLLNADKEKQAAVSAEQRKRLYIILAGSLLLLIAASGFLNYYVRSNLRQKLANIELSGKNNTIGRQKDEIESQKVIVEQKNRDIFDSIEYASRIQQAIIPDEAEMARVLGREFFVFHRQKDIIGGDFYFVTKVHDEILIAVADCTGHGVPGAMLSMLGKDQLNELVNGRGVTEPKTLLEKLDEQITIALNPNRKMEIPDGMDMAVIRLADNVIGFSGANRPLVLVRNNELHEYKGTRTGIGGGGEKKTFENCTLELRKGDTIYLYTDGYADQSGGPKNKKFKSRLLRDVLKEISSKGMNEQKEILQRIFEDWKGSGEQTDDVTVIGVRV